jgi:hypothetical protein
VLDHQRVGEISAVTVARADWLGEPAQFASAARRATQPVVFVPAQCRTGEDTVVLARTFRTARAVHGDVHFVDLVEVLAEIGHQQPGESR